MKSKVKSTWYHCGVAIAAQDGHIGMAPRQIVCFGGGQIRVASASGSDLAQLPQREYGTFWGASLPEIRCQMAECVAARVAAA